MDLDLAGKSVLITGASKGIGLACARAFALEGCNLHLVARSAERLDVARKEVLSVAGVSVSTYPADLASPAAVQSIVAECSEVDILVNNAGGIPGGSIEDIDGPSWREGWNLKLFGYIDATREMLSYMYGRNAGVIVNIIGTGGVMHSYEYAPGSTGNAALMAFTNAVGSRSVDRGVRVVGVNPGAVDTDRYHQIVDAAIAKSDDSATQAWQHYLTGDLPFGRPGRPEEIADLVVFLASARASYISGTVVNIDGGRIFR